MRDDASPPRFVLVSDHLECRRLLARASQERVKARIRLSMTSDWFATRVLEDDTAKAGLIVAASVDLGKDFPGIDHVEQCLSILFLPGQILLGIKSTRFRRERNCIHILPPLRIFKLERRKEARYEIPGGYELDARLHAPMGRGKVRRRILDLSPSGLGILLPNPKESHFFRLGDVLKGVCFQIENRDLQVDVEVCNQVLFEESPGFPVARIGLRFFKIRREDEEFLEHYVAKHLVAYAG